MESSYVVFIVEVFPTYSSSPLNYIARARNSIIRRWLNYFSEFHIRSFAHLRMQRKKDDKSKTLMVCEDIQLEKITWNKKIFKLPSNDKRKNNRLSTLNCHTRMTFYTK